MSRDAAKAAVASTWIGDDVRDSPHLILSRDIASVSWGFYKQFAAPTAIAKQPFTRQNQW
jgi:hypothetical protein